ncbi:plasmid maintenance system antidote protein VapI [Clostridium saccharoperbutylacetonicum]|uniref:Plasmid maintenance system antidote protein n=1 Tax=Clostridium saccharoperbutylacetonicum N1-4(HMT) TaxID=931276 RepID=M1M1H1_9CLOT|nr:helix-turn-helix transcriptional regulator [Clostridium saccharoperbutylacetonicum]AGF59460.1 plasmid maintenance system antidote protein [Clostridium saccharoperbutylacetonicum N1-4(HMT)]NRT59746.1 plasmid maintenance system antidote protein VapI [Clostridium saccharoperbutylacetonicum]NSB23058.1 plasmid maintenance system antidote protein VapI [Clostridium saccharoperbutylacetonicum]NSB42429.1 plasmid maintenance system antidote protein VapI [Clostridium saccharoperbutylacetonicum]
MLKLDIKKLVLLQAKACLNTNELAEIAKMPRATITNIVHGKRNASPKTIGLLARALNVDVTEIIINEK